MTPVTLALGFTCDWCGASLAFEEHQPDCRRALEEGSNEQWEYRAEDLEEVYEPEPFDDDLYEVIDMENAQWIVA